MTNKITNSINQSTTAEIAAHLSRADTLFAPSLSSRLDIHAYAQKLQEFAFRFEAWLHYELVGLVAIYCNHPDKIDAFVTSVSVLPQCQGQGIAKLLMLQCIEHVRCLGFCRMELEVHQFNRPAVALYQKVGFNTLRKSGSMIIMGMTLEGKNTMSSSRDYNAEINDTADHQYAYSFDFDVMHPFMIRSFEPFFRKGSLLELGSYKGDFTRRLRERFNDITCVEASGKAIDEARHKVGDGVQFIHSIFESVTLPRRYDNIVLTHALEHLDDPVRVLKRVNEEWLAEEGRFFLVCPNANAPSRQIAVKMGLISHNAAVTPAEDVHGHRCTYSLDTLERDAVVAGLQVVHRSGIFFKALANFQWDRLLQTDIISKEYLEGCYKLGQLYPDLCSSVFLMCERGDSLLANRS
jgi:ribosomal protein S18 acetylase RimI-like enzyme/SAM-dependent methyltransferase